MSHLNIKVIIIGADLCGLATAFRLSQLGHSVHVIDKAGPHEPTGGIHCMPNLTKCLVHWGLDSKVKELAAPKRAARMLSLDTGNVMCHFEWDEDVLQETGGEYLLMQHQDLWDVLYDAALEAGTQFSFNTRAISARADPPQVELSSGQILEADMVIGTDGPQSIVRKAVTTEFCDERPTGLCAYVGEVSRNLFKDDQELYKFTDLHHKEGSDSTVWIGEGRHASSLIVGGGEVVAIHLFLEERVTECSHTEDVASDSVVVKKEALNIPVEPKLQRLLKHIPEFQRKRLYHRKAPEKWADDSGRLLLMGEAAYPSMPYSRHCASMQIEDAAVLTTLFAKLKTKDQIPDLVRGFHEIRQHRVLMVYRKERKHIEYFQLPSGPERDARDHAFQKIMDNWRKGLDGSKVPWQWAEIMDVSAYHAIEAAEDWWVVWGMPRERSGMADAWGSPSPSPTHSSVDSVGSY